MQNSPPPECFKMTNFDRFHREAIGVRGFDDVLDTDCNALYISKYH